MKWRNSDDEGGTYPDDAEGVAVLLQASPGGGQGLLRDVDAVGRERRGDEAADHQGKQDALHLGCVRRDEIAQCVRDLFVVYVADQ